MKILVGVPDPTPDGVHETKQGELLILRPGEVHYGKRLALCRRSDCHCARSWTGSASDKAATLAKVVEPPPCFNLKPELASDIFIADSLRVAAMHPTGTLLRVRFNWRRGAERLHFEDPREFLNAWDITVAGGPN
jgi:hypothetical protein